MATTDLADFVESLKGALAVPGTFSTTFPSTSDDDLLLALANGFAEAQLDGFFAGNDVDLGTFQVTEAISNAEGALVVIYASTRVLESQLRDTKSHVKYVAGSVSFEQDTAASVLTELLKGMRQRKKDLREAGMRAGTADAFYMADAYLANNTGYFGGF